MKFSRGSKVPNITEPNGLQFCSRIEARQTVVRSPSKLSARKNRRPQPACPRCCRGPGAAPAWIRWLATGSSTSPPSTLSSTSPPSSRSIHPMPMPRFHAIPSIHPAGLRALGNCAVHTFISNLHSPRRHDTAPDSVDTPHFWCSSMKR
jgi:hypothetical protein